MAWLLTYTPVLLFGLAFMVILRRHSELREYAQVQREQADAKDRGSHKARLQHPDIDLSQCIGCGTCIKACPEEGVLALQHGQVVVVHGARCVGHGLCATACPTGAIALTLGDLSDRRDLPAIDQELEVVGVPGLFLAGELGGFALIRTAVSQGIAVADAVAQRLRTQPAPSACQPQRQLQPVAVGAASGEAPSWGGQGEEEPAPEAGHETMDFIVVGTGPGGLACSLRAKELGLNFVTLEQEEMLGGTVASYPRRKLVMTQPMDLPLHGRLTKLTFQKEELIEIWEKVAKEQDLPIRTGVRLLELDRDEQGVFLVKTSAGVLRARNVCLALGRRGTPRKLGVPGEDLPKVAYSLLDAESYQNRNILVVGGGDSAIEAALGLAKQPGNQVTLSYRKKALFRLKARNESRIQKALKEGQIKPLFRSQVVAVEKDQVRLMVGEGDQATETVLPNDEVFVFAGGIPPFGLLEKAGVSFDPKDRPPPEELVDKGTGLLTAMAMVLAAATVMMVWATWNHGYYSLPAGQRAASEQYDWLRPSGPVGFTFGVLACVLFVWNLSYLLRRSVRWGGWIPGTLKFWMGSHVFTGLFGFLCVLVHAGFTVRHTVGGHAFAALTVVVVTGTIGRYLYAFVPRAANGSELDLVELRSQLAALSGEWDRDGRGFGATVRKHVDDLINVERWRGALPSRIVSLLVGQVRLRLIMRSLYLEGRREQIPVNEVRHILTLAKKAYRLTLLVTHYEEVRAILSSWRYFHRWLALLMVLLAVLHIITAVRYADLSWVAAMFWGGGVS